MLLGNFIEDNIISISGSNKDNLTKLLLLDFKIRTGWFFDNFIIINPGKCSYMCLGKNNDDDKLRLPKV